MTIGESVRHGIHYARTCKSLWLFGFVVGIATSGGSGGGAGGGSQSDGSTGGVPFGLSLLDFPLLLVGLAVAIVLAAVIALIVRFLSEGALIEGVVRARQGETMKLSDGVRAGWAHWGVLLRIALLYVTAVIGSLGLLVVPCVLAYRAFGTPGGIAVGVAAVVAAVPVLVTLHMVQAFASRIAVIENRRALDAVHKARLFLHGRIMHGLRLVVATLIGTMVFALTGVAAVVAVALLVRALMTVVQLPIAIFIGGVLLVPVAFVVIAMMGTYKSSIWTIGYVTEVKA